VPGGLTGWVSFEPHAERLSDTRRVILVALAIYVLLVVIPGFDPNRASHAAFDGAYNGTG
jgi:hypothetical protein